MKALVQRVSQAAVDGEGPARRRRASAYHCSMASRTQPLLSSGNETIWARINREEAEQLRAANMALTPTERLDQGQRLSQQAVSLLAASIHAGHAPRRALWS